MNINKVNIKAKAALMTFALFAGVIFLAFILSEIVARSTPEQLINIIIAGAFGVMVYTVYSVFLNHLKYKETLKQLTTLSKDKQ